MASDGAALSLDDYIKVKRKQGAFKGKGVRGRGGGISAGANAGRRKAKFVTGKGKRGGGVGGRGVKGQGRGGRVNQGINRRGSNFGARGGRGRGNVRNARNNYRQLQPQHYANANVGAGGVATNNFRQGRARGGQRQRNFGRNRNFGVGVGVSQHLAGAGARRQRQRPAAVGVVANRRSVMKLAKKRVARARAQLIRQKSALTGGFGVNRRIGRGKGQGFRNKGFLQPLLTVASGVRRTRTGFVTVSNPLEKQIQRLAVKEKIQKARAIRLNRGNFNAAGNSRNSVQAAAGPSRQRQRPRQQAMAQQQLSPTRRPSQNLYNSPVRRHEPQQRRQRQEYYASTPPRSMTMYADAEPGGWDLGRGRHDSPPLMRTMVNNSYDPRHPSLDYGGAPAPQQREILNPEIQRKINFIQSHGSRGQGAGSGSPGIIPDFRAPPISSTMKLSDRFRLYMN